MVFSRLRNHLCISMPDNEFQTSPNSSRPQSRSSSYFPSVHSLSRTSSWINLFASSKTAELLPISPYAVRPAVSPNADMTTVTIYTGSYIRQHPRALLEHNSPLFKRELRNEGILSELEYQMPACLEPSAVKAALDIVVSNSEGWKLTNRAPLRPISSPTSAVSSWRAKKNGSSHSHSFCSSRSTSSSDGERENSLWWMQLFEVGRYLQSEAVLNLATSGYRKAMRSQSIHSLNFYADVDYLNSRELWDTKLGAFITSLLAFEARSPVTEYGAPERVEQMFEDAPSNAFMKVQKQWRELSGLEKRNTQPEWEDLVNPVIAMACMWHGHTHTKACVADEEKQRWAAMVSELKMTGNAKSKARIMKKAM